MNGNQELLNYIYQNSMMGVDTISQLLDIVEDQDYKKLLQSQRNEYEKISKEVRDELNKHGCDEKGISMLSKISTYLTINIQTLLNKTPSHISEMMIQGSVMGIIQAIKKIKQYDDADKDVLNLMKKLLKFEENNVEELKKFL